LIQLTKFDFARTRLARLNRRHRHAIAEISPGWANHSACDELLSARRWISRRRNPPSRIHHATFRTRAADYASLNPPYELRADQRTYR
jgi:hypothetical protein